ncbi:hypothetical protein PLESTF_000923600, partial [Pleodorina starrii]
MRVAWPQEPAVAGWRWQDGSAGSTPRFSSSDVQQQLVMNAAGGMQALYYAVFEYGVVYRSVPAAVKLSVSHATLSRPSLYLEFATAPVLGSNDNLVIQRYDAGSNMLLDVARIPASIVNGTTSRILVDALPARAALRTVGPICDLDPNPVLTCSNGFVITNIVSAFFGHTDKVTCSYQPYGSGAIQNTGCSDANFMSYVSGLCLGKRSCSIPRVTDPCLYTY